MKKSKQLSYDPEVIKNGEHIADVTFGKAFTPNILEKLVQRAAVISGDKVDWINRGRGAEVYALGDIDRAKRFIEEGLRPYIGKYTIVKDRNLHLPFPEPQ